MNFLHGEKGLTRQSVLRDAEQCTGEGKVEGLPRHPASRPKSVIRENGMPRVCGVTIHIISEITEKKTQ